MSAQLKKIYFSILCTLCFCFQINAQIAIDFKLNKTNDVAPFKLLVDATETNDPSINASLGEKWNFHNLHFEWDFGDDPNAVWSHSGKNKNIGYGPVYGHVYERPGTYTITLRVINPLTGEQATEQQTITVTDPDIVFSGNNTICFSTSGDFSDAPAGALHVTTANFKDALDTYAKSGKRLLFKRGEEWTANDFPNRITEDGPSLIGAFGTGPKPKFIAEPGCNRIMAISEPKTNVTTNWRVMDLEFDGSRNIITGGITVGGNDMLLLRLDMHDMNGGVGFGSSALDFELERGFSPVLHSDFGIVDCTINRIGVPMPGGGVGIFGACDDLIIMGTELIDNTLGEHNIRITYGNKVTIAHNNIVQPARSKQCLTIRAMDFENETGVFRGKTSELFVVSDNRLYADLTFLMSNAGIGNGNGGRPKVFDVIFERNFFESDGTVSTPLSIDSFRSTVRNNIVLSKGVDGSGISVRKLDGSFPDRVEAKIYNNSFVTQSGVAVSLRRLGIPLEGCEMYNNMMVDDPSRNNMILINPATTDALFSDNLKTLNPGTVSNVYNTPNDFALLPTSPLIDQGRTVPNLLDFFGNRRDVSRIDLGAVEHTELPACTSLTAPMNGDENVALSTTLTWNEIVTANGYFITIRTEDGTLIEDNLDVGNNTTYVPTIDFPEDTIIYVTITPYNAEGNAMGCVEEHFRTIGSEEPLEITFCPENQEVPCSTTTIPDFRDAVTTNRTDGVTLVQMPENGTEYLGGTEIITILADDGTGNTDSCSFTINRLEVSLEAGNDQNITEGEEVELEATASDQGTFLWSPAIGLSTTTSPNPVANPLETTTYTVLFTNVEGCTVEDSVTVFVNGLPRDETKYGFSPDGDGINECWLINGIEAYPDNEVLIYNRWKDLVYRTQGYDNATRLFCGIANKKRGFGANVLPEGTYFFRIIINGEHNLPKVEGFVMLKR